MSKIRQYFSTIEIIKGFVIALLSSAFIYLNYLEFSYPLLNTILAVMALYLLLQEEEKVWFFSGFFIGLFWFWWILISFKYYEMIWAIPIGLLVIMLAYGAIFWFIAKVASVPVGCCASTTPHLNFAQKLYCPFIIKWCCGGTTPCISTLIVKAIGLLLLSYIHPFGFDWLKPELMFVESYLGIEKWQLAIILIGIILSIWKKQLLFLFLILFAYQPTVNTSSSLPDTIQIVSTNTPVKEKWDESLHSTQFDAVFESIDKAIDANKTLIVLPESVFPIFINRSQTLMDKLQKKSNKISIVTGGLYWDGSTPRNSTYIFTKKDIKIAHKVLLVPFGESNPLPEFLSKWVNRVFYDGAIDYKASNQVTDYKIGDKVYRNAICFEATSEKLYSKDKEGNHPNNMIVLSNNGWFTPSIEPTQQKLLLQYYSKKYGTTIYHAVNMSESYVIRNGEIEE